MKMYRDKSSGYLLVVHNERGYLYEAYKNKIFPLAYYPRLAGNLPPPDPNKEWEWEEIVWDVWYPSRS